MRYAIYFTPAQDAPLTRVAARWLGRDAFTGAPLAHAEVDGFSQAELAFHTASARRYGFHATLKAPFRLRDDVSEAKLGAALDAFAAGVQPVVIPRLAVGQLDEFFALLPAEPCPDMLRFAADVVEAFDRFRAPLTDREIERRNPDALSAAEFRNLCLWGYPYVFDTFRFHMTLTGRVKGLEALRLHAAIERQFGEVLSEPVAVDALTLFVEREPGAPFVAQSRHPLRGQARKRA